MYHESNHLDTIGFIEPWTGIKNVKIVKMYKFESKNQIISLFEITFFEIFVQIIFQCTLLLFAITKLLYIFILHSAQ